MRLNSSSSISRTGVGELTPAPLIRMSARPHWLRTSSRRASRAARLPTSAAIKRDFPPLSEMEARRAAAFSSLRPTRTASAPACANPSAMAPQSSPVPPITIATLPSSEKRLLRNSDMRRVSRAARRIGQLRPGRIGDRVEPGASKYEVWRSGGLLSSISQNVNFYKTHAGHVDHVVCLARKDTTY